MQIGNSEFSISKVKGLAFNEAANQYIVAELLNRKYREVNINNINAINSNITNQNKRKTYHERRID